MNIDGQIVLSILATIAQLVGAFSVLAGVLIARGQLRQAQNERTFDHRIATAIEVLELVHSVQRRVVQARLPVSYGPTEFEGNERNFFRTRLGQIEEVLEDIARLRVLSEYIDFRFSLGSYDDSSTDAGTALRQYDWEVMNVNHALGYLYAYPNRNERSGEDAQTWDEQFEIAISPEFNFRTEGLEANSIDVTGHNLHVLSRTVINAMSCHVRKDAQR